MRRSARPSKDRTPWTTTDGRWPSVGVRDMRPVSSSARSSSWFTSHRRRVPFRSARRSCVRTSSPRAPWRPSRRVSMGPRVRVSGRRNAWLISSRNWDLAVRISSSVSIRSVAVSSASRAASRSSRAASMRAAARRRTRRRRRPCRSTIAPIPPPASSTPPHPTAAAPARRPATSPPSPKRAAPTDIPHGPVHARTAGPSESAGGEAVMTAVGLGRE